MPWFGMMWLTGYGKREKEGKEERIQDQADAGRTGAGEDGEREIYRETAAK